MWTLHSPKQLDLIRFQRVWWDPVHQHFVVMNNGLFQAVDIDGHLSNPLPVKDGQIAMLAKYSLDLSLIALQISDSSLIIAEVSGTRTWRIDCKGPANALLQSGFVWSDHGGNSQDLVLITQKGIEFYKISLKRGQCKLSRTIAHPTHTWWYAAERRLLLIGTGQSSGTEMRGFFLKVAVGDYPRIELPPPDKVPCFSFAPISTNTDTAIPFKSNNIALVFLYHETYIARILVQSRSIQLYRISPKDLVLHTHTLDLLSLDIDDDDLSIELSVVDNLVIVHVKSSTLSFTFDIKSEKNSSSPNTQPLSIGPSQCPYPRRALQFLLIKPIAITSINIPSVKNTSLSSSSSITSQADGGSERGSDCDIFYQRWKLLWPDKVLDTSSTTGSVYDIKMNVYGNNACVDMSFLLRRGMIKSKLNLLPTPQTLYDMEVTDVSKVALLSAMRSKLADRPSCVSDTDSVNHYYLLLLSPYVNVLRSKLNDINSISNAEALESSFDINIFNKDNDEINLLLNKYCSLDVSKQWPPPPTILRNPSKRRGSLISNNRRGSSASMSERDSPSVTRRNSLTAGSFKESSSPASAVSSSSSGGNQDGNDGYSAVVLTRAIEFKAIIHLSNTDLVLEDKPPLVDLREGMSEEFHDVTWDSCKEMVREKLENMCTSKTRENVPPRDPTNSYLVISQVDFLKLVFEPLAKSRTLSSPALAHNMLQFLEVLRVLRIPLVCQHIPAMIVSLLSRCGHVRDIVQLSYYKVIPDSLTVCLALIKASDIHYARMLKKYKSSSEKLSYSSDDIQDGTRMEQVVLDTLWRCGEGVAVVGRLLLRGNIHTAVSLCTSSMKSSEVPLSRAMESLQHISAKQRISSHKFLLAAMIDIKKHSSVSSSTKHSHESFDILCMVVQFLKRWDPDCLIRSEQGVSKLALSLPGLFTHIPSEEPSIESNVALELMYGLSTESYQTLRHQFGFDSVRSVHDL